MIKTFKYSTILFIFAFSLTSFGQNIDPNIQVIKSYLNNLPQEEFSGTILVAKDDSIIFKRAYGMANIEYGIKNEIETKFNIASITKMITAVAILQLYENKKLELHVPIGKYLPEYPNKIVRDSVTIHQLLSHSSGLNNFYVTAQEKMKNLDYNKVSDFVPLFVNDSLLSVPGTQYHYSATGFVILGLIIEKVSGKNYYNYVQENIFKAAKMLNTAELQIDSIVTNRASGYTSMFGENKTLKKNDYYLTKASPGGFHYSTIEDLFNFSKALRNYELLKKETTDLMFESKIKGYNTHMGYGIDVDKRYNQTILGHSGGWYGIHTELMDFMDDHITIVILSNIDDGGKEGASKVSNFFMELLSGKKTEK